jgi:PRC-barrel domain protein
MMKLRSIALAPLFALLLATLPAYAAGPAGGAHTQGQQAPDADERTPEERMNARFPQKVRVGDLIGIAIQDYDDRILGHVTDVVRKPDGKIVLVMPEGRWLWRSGRPVPIPIETVALLARHINLLDIPGEDVPKLPTWDPAQGSSIDKNEIIRIAIGRR